MRVSMDAEKVHALREGLTPVAVEFAERASISPNTLRRAECGRGPVRFHTAARSLGPSMWK
jgi:DNA-binding transcriptional regulator YiaG